MRHWVNHPLRRAAMGVDPVPYARPLSCTIPYWFSASAPSGSGRVETKGGQRSFRLRLTAHKPWTDVDRGPRVALCRCICPPTVLADAEPPVTRAAGYIVQTLMCFMPCSSEHKCHAGNPDRVVCSDEAFLAWPAWSGHTFWRPRRPKAPDCHRRRKYPWHLLALPCFVVARHGGRAGVLRQSHGAAVMGILCHAPQSRPCVVTARSSLLFLRLSAHPNVQDSFSP